MIVVPVINCPDAVSAKKKIDILAVFLPKDSWIHLDVTDGIFSEHRTWHDPSVWSAMHVPFKLEVHLMVIDPEAHADIWISAGAKRVIVHVEAFEVGSFQKIFNLCDAAGVELMVAMKPGTSVDSIQPYTELCSAFQILAVSPGPAAQKFDEGVLSHLKMLRENMPNAIIEVDGGINLETAKKVKADGANIIVSSTYIFENGDPEKAYNELKAI